MSKHFLIASASLLVCALTFSSTLGSSAEAASNGSVTWRFTQSRISASTPVRVTFTATDVRPGSFISFERQFGTAHVWKAVDTFPLGHVATSVNLPAVQVGAYLYKARVTTGRKVDYFSAPHWLYAYGSVSLTTLCVANTLSGGGCGDGSVQLQNSRIYTYEFESLTGQKASPGGTALSFPNTSCRSGILTIETGFTSNLDPGDTTYVQITQSASDPQIASLPDTSQTTFSFNLDGGPFDVDEWHSGGQDQTAWVYYSGVFNCYTLNGLR
jgi:hypothetical protein